MGSSDILSEMLGFMQMSPTFFAIVACAMALFTVLFRHYLMKCSSKAKKRKNRLEYMKLCRNMNKRTLEHIIGVLTDMKCKEVPSWVSFPQYEKSKFLNCILQDLWSGLDKAVSSIIVSVVDPILMNLAPPGVTKFGFHKFSLGSVPMNITGVRVLEEEIDAMTLELRIHWLGDPTIQLKLGGPAIYGGLQDLKVSLDDLDLTGTLQIKFYPLIPVYPMFSGLRIMFLDKPFVHTNLDVKAIPGLPPLSVTSVPGLGPVLQNLVPNILDNLMVFPRSLPVTLAEEKRDEFGKSRWDKHLRAQDLLVQRDKPFFDVLFSRALALKSDVLKSTGDERKALKAYNDFVIAGKLEKKAKMIESAQKAYETAEAKARAVGKTALEARNLGTRERLRIYDPWAVTWDDPGSVRSQLTVVPIGELHVTLVCAKNLKSTTFDLPDGYVKIDVGNQRQELFKSKVIANTTDPVWNEEFKFTIHNLRIQSVNFVVVDEGNMSDNVLGHCSIRLHDLHLGAGVELEVKRSFPQLKSKRLGTLIVKLKFSEYHSVAEVHEPPRSRPRGSSPSLDQWTDEQLREMLEDAVWPPLPLWARYPAWEKSFWLQTALDHLWIYLSRAVNNSIKGSVEPILEKLINPNILKIRFGDMWWGDDLTGPVLSGAASRRTNGNEATLDLDLFWASDALMEIIATPFRNPLWNITVIIKDIQLFSTARVTFTDLISVFPLFAGIKVQLLETRELSASITLKISPFLPAMELSGLPGFQYFFSEILVKKIINGVVGLGHPNSLNIQLSEPSSSQSASKYVGSLSVKIVEAHGLPNMDTFGLSDPYVMICANADRFYRSAVVHDTLDPCWNETVRVLVEDLETTKVTIGVYDYDQPVLNQVSSATWSTGDLPGEHDKNFSSILEAMDTLERRLGSDKMGSAEIDVSHLVDGADPVRMVIPLERVSKQKAGGGKIVEAGDITIELSYAKLGANITNPDGSPNMNSPGTLFVYVDKVSNFPVKKTDAGVCSLLTRPLTYVVGSPTYEEAYLSLQVGAEGRRSSTFTHRNALIGQSFEYVGFSPSGLTLCISGFGSDGMCSTDLLGSLDIPLEDIVASGKLTMRGARLVGTDSGASLSISCTWRN